VVRGVMRCTIKSFNNIVLGGASRGSRCYAVLLSEWYPQMMSFKVKMNPAFTGC